MEIKYQSGLPHQKLAVDAITKVFDKVDFAQPVQMYENPKINLEDAHIGLNISTIQNDKKYNVKSCVETNKLLSVCPPTLTLDIKMETGTGKTYVYTHTIYELHKQYGINKFIIAVPSLAIKEGAKSFLNDSDVKRHFSNTLGYNVELNLYVLQALKNSNKGKKGFPSELSKFVNANYQMSNQIYVLLVNMGLLSDRADGMLSRFYDNAPQGYYVPYDAMCATRPFLIIDEPHRFSRDQKAYTIIAEKIKPQCIIRFGATFPDTTEGKGKNKVVKKDYENLLYNLNSCQAFNQNLIKGVAKEHYEDKNNKNEKIKIIAINGKDNVVFSHIKVDGSNSYTLRKNDSLSMISREMDSLTIENIGKDFVEFSNGQTKYKGEEFDVSVYSQSYQEAMIFLALKRHFETERQNFNRSQRIKTLALFFIDDINSFRGDETGKNAWLRDAFERLLKAKIEDELKNENNSAEYADFLTHSLNNLRECSAGYFAQDNSDSDEAVAKEVDDILRNKKDLLVFKDKEGRWNVRRFLFSKWTLKEGWDNPNVFTIAKLRSSGSENSKIQEVGRGLRLPVDEYGNRISNDEFKLNYIVDFKEADFANRLVAEINGELSSSKNVSKIDEQDLERIAVQRNTTADDLFDELRSKKYIDRNYNIITENITDFYNEYPEFKPADSVKRDKITDRNKHQKFGVKIRSDKYLELKELWQKLNRRYVIFFENQLNEKIENDFHLNGDVFSFVELTSHRDVLNVTEKGANIACESGTPFHSRGKKIAYNDFLKRLNKATSLPIKLIHSKVAEYFTNHEFDGDYINETTIANFITYFDDWKVKNVLGLLHYKQASYSTLETALTDINGVLKPEIPQGRIGLLFSEGKPADNYLYDKIAYDSELEKDNILADIDQVIVFGKIPNRSIAIPTVLDNYSPDFMYVVKKKDGKTELNIVIETKGVDKSGELRGVENLRIECAKKYFEQLQADGFDVKFQTQINNKGVKKIVEDLME
ncbi:MAG: type III restriction-modification system endonuclease [Bacteroidales bacterium]|nr:type III restriction-modification system endonuclease [Bacteroidales bacterium]